MRLIQNICLVILFFHSFSLVSSQTPFNCNGRMFRVLEAQGGSIFEEISFDNTGKINFTERQSYLGERINGIAFHPSQNLIYGVLLGKSYQLCRIDANYKLEKLRTLPLPENLLFVSGDVSPDEKYLVLLGFSPDETTNLLALVDLTVPGFSTTVFPLSTTDASQPAIYCADIAFHPTDNQLYGFDHLAGRMVTIDLGKRQIDNTRFPTTEVLTGNVPSIFFDAFGNLFGIGAPYRGLATNRRLYQFNLQNGLVTDLERLRFEGNQDACSCPYQVKLLNRISNRVLAPCTEIRFEFILINRTDFEQTEVVFRDTFPVGFIIKALSDLPFTGQIERGIGGRILEISTINLPVGVDTFWVDLTIDQEVIKGPMDNRAYLDGILLSSLTEIETVRSDDPETTVSDDATHFIVEDLRADFSEQPRHFCLGDSLVLDPKIRGPIQYRWSTGDTTDRIIIREPGNYALTITSACDTTSVNIHIQQEQVVLDLGEDKILEEGDSLQLKARIESTSDVETYFWQSSEPNTLSCTTCHMPFAIPKDKGYFDLLVRNKAGCTATDRVALEIQDFTLYAPNAFSPDSDGANDNFFLFTRSPQKILSFQIFDRWGNLLFEQKDVWTNNESVGWNGLERQRIAPTGVYVWVAELLLKNGERKLLKGSVQLLR